MNNADFLIRFNSPRLGYGSVVLDNSALLEIPQGVSVVLGENGAGKSTLGLVMEIHSSTGIDVVSHEQRLESTVNDFVPTVAEIVGPLAEDGEWLRLCEAFALRDVNSKRVNYLSSGELRKLLVINALRSRPDLLILDNPYIGLDAASRS